MAYERNGNQFSMAGQLDVLILLRMRTGRSWIVNEAVYTRFREKELRIYTKGNCLSNSPIIIGHHLLWLDYHFVRMSQTRSLSPSHFPFLPLSTMPYFPLGHLVEQYFFILKHFLFVSSQVISLPTSCVQIHKHVHSCSGQDI